MDTNAGLKPRAGALLGQLGQLNGSAWAHQQHGDPPSHMTLNGSRTPEPTAAAAAEAAAAEAAAAAAPMPLANERLLELKGSSDHRLGSGEWEIHCQLDLDLNDVAVRDPSQPGQPLKDPQTGMYVVSVRSLRVSPAIGWVAIVCMRGAHICVHPHPIKACSM